MFEQLMTNMDSYTKISKASFNQWVEEYSFNALRTGERLGMLFCRTNGIKDYLLTYTLDNTEAIKHINSYYVKND
jgi:hypothetical protein